MQVLIFYVCIAGTTQLRKKYLTILVSSYVLLDSTLLKWQSPLYIFTETLGVYYIINIDTF